MEEKANKSREKKDWKSKRDWKRIKGKKNTMVHEREGGEREILKNRFKE